jgi:hypothetical protein
VGTNESLLVLVFGRAGNDETARHEMIMYKNILGSEHAVTGPTAARACFQSISSSLPRSPVNPSPRLSTGGMFSQAAALSTFPPTTDVFSTIGGRCSMRTSCQAAAS